MERLKLEKPQLDELCLLLRITYEDLDNDLAEERVFVTEAVSTVEEEDMGIEYVEKLVKLRSLMYVSLLELASIRFNLIFRGKAYDAAQEFAKLDRPEGRSWSSKKTKSVRTKARTTLVRKSNYEGVVLDFEEDNRIEVRWLPDDPEYLEACEKLKDARFKKAIRELERLLVKRFFEMEKINMAGVGKPFNLVISVCFI